MTDADPTMVRPVETVGHTIMVYDGCGLTLEGERIFCDDKRLEGRVDPYGKPLSRTLCECRGTAKVVIARLRELGAFNDQFMTAIDAERKP